MNFPQPINFAALIKPVADILLGEPNKRLSNPPTNVRFGTHGSMAINFEDGTFYDHEAKIGGGTLDLIGVKTGKDRREAVTWLRDQGLIDSAASNGSSSTSVRTTPATFPASAPAGAIKATYDYVDEGDKLLFQVVRQEPKDFRQRQPGAEPGTWIEHVKGVRRVIYRLPDIIAATSTGDVVYVVEGEKDADRLGALGLVATTCPGGAGKWLAQYSEVMRDADVVIIPDNDKSGRDHAAQVATSLNGIAKRIRILDLAKHWPECPEKGDVSDWLDADGTADRIVQMIEAAVEWKSVTVTPTARRLVMAEEAYHGLVGDFVRTIEPHSESDPAALLIQFLTAIGNAIGRGPFYQIEGDRHFAKLNVVLVGATSGGRKGTSLNRVLQVMELADENWTQYRVQTGLASGEGLIHHVRDPASKLKDGKTEIVDPGVPDKRLLIDAQEFASVLAVMGKPGNTLSAVIRDAWGHKVLQTLGKTSPDKATGSHISVIGHITEPELRRMLTRTEMANGFANRFLFAKTQRSKKLANGGNLAPAELMRLGESTKAVIEVAKGIGRVVMTPEAAGAWEAIYHNLDDDAGGMVGEVTARAAPQMIRIALIYAVLDDSVVIELAHLKAAAAVWEYCEESARQIFGGSLGDPVADAILAALRSAPNGMSRDELGQLFHWNKSAALIGDALASLERRGLARRSRSKPNGRGRPTETWFAV